MRKCHKILFVVCVQLASTESASPGRSLQWNADPETLGCTPQPSFVKINFDDAHLIRSNLGGQGGRCSSTDLCEETCAPCAGQTCTEAECLGKMEHEIFIKNVAISGALCSRCVHASAPRVSAAPVSYLLDRLRRDAGLPAELDVP